MLNQVDVCFVVDTTGSMGSFIAQAKAKLLETISLLSADSKMDLHIGLVEYRDHPPQDNSFITRVYPLTANLKQMQKNIDKLIANGGGDGPEAVYRGVYDACEQMPWRQYSCRFVILVGDAPPHGFAKWYQEATGSSLRFGHSDAWADGCPSGLDVHRVGAMAEKQRAKVYGISMGTHQPTDESFKAIATNSGGFAVASSNAANVINQIITLLQQEFSNILFDQQVLDQLNLLQELDINQLAKSLDSPRLPVAESVARLGSRGFLSPFLTTTTG